MLGEYVLPGSGSAWQEALVAALGTLEYKPQAARQALARSIADGWLHPERHGRRSRVHLTDEASAMLTAGAQRIYNFAQSWDWDGHWLLVMVRVPENRRDVRHQMRTRLAWAGFGSLGGGTWISPHVERESELHAIVHDYPAAEFQSFHARFGSLGEPSKLVANAWDLDAVAKAYHDFIARFQRMQPKTPEGVFQAQTRLVHAWRKFPFLDPDLPEAVLPAGWPRARAHELFDSKHAAWHIPAQDYFTSLEAVADPHPPVRVRAA
jgi:phenylacetic acid degradation operon negative regulatory protein